MEIPIHFQQVYLFPNDAAKWLFTTEPMICCGDFVVLKKTIWWLEIKVNYFLKTLIALWRTKLTNLKMQSKWKALWLRIRNLWWINLGSPPLSHHWHLLLTNVGLREGKVGSFPETYIDPLWQRRRWQHWQRQAHALHFLVSFFVFHETTTSKGTNLIAKLKQQQRRLQRGK